MPSLSHRKRLNRLRGWGGDVMAPLTSVIIHAINARRKIKVSHGKFKIK